jgi:hypothetical protein
MVEPVVASFSDRGVPAEVPVVEWPRIVVIIGDEAVHRHHVVHDDRAHRVLLESPCAFTAILSTTGATGL